MRALKGDGFVPSGMRDGRDAAGFLAGSDDRWRLLAHLRDSPGSTSEVADAFGVAHRTVQRNLRELTERGWVRKRDGVYEVTTAGAVVADVHAEYLDRLAAVTDLSPVLRHVTDLADAPPPELLGDATVVAASADDPQAPLDHYLTAVRESETSSVLMVSPVLSRLYHDVHARKVLGGATTRLVLPAGLVERAREENPREFSFVLRVPGFSLYEHDGPVGAGITLTDDVGILCGYDDDGQLRACATGRSDAFLSWLRERFESYRERSAQVSASGPLG